MNLISRFYDIEDGVISVDGYDLTKISIESLRRQMGVMTQDNFIFHGTVRENILYGKLDATDEEMIAAAKAVNAHEFIMKMEKGYDTELKEHGAGLSIGQRQLIAFARTMISMPKILILDEATSSIDTHTEILVQKGIEALLSGRTSFVIAHRPFDHPECRPYFCHRPGRHLRAGKSGRADEEKRCLLRSLHGAVRGAGIKNWKMRRCGCGCGWAGKVDLVSSCDKEVNLVGS